MTSFVDRAVLHVAAGDGGHGCASVHREKFRPLGGPDGGNGGDGGDVVLVVDSSVHTLLDFHYHPHQRARNGRPGQGDNRDGANGEDLVLPVPDGTVVQSSGGEVLADLTGLGTRFVLARGGRGGLGNAALASKRRKAPGFALLGEPGERLDAVLELKSVADVGLVGFPSAGKSSLIAAMSAARPKIADYPFTTLVPNLGVVRVAESVFTMADVPGLIPGAAAGRGLGLAFLRHVERCAVLVHVVDCATLEPGRDPLSDIEAVEAELRQYAGGDRQSGGGWSDGGWSGGGRSGGGTAGDGWPRRGAAGDGGSGGEAPAGGWPVDGAQSGGRLGGGRSGSGPLGGDLAERARIVVLNKIDVPEARELADLVRTELEARGYRVFAISAATHEGLPALGYALANEVEVYRASLPPIEPARLVIHPPLAAGPEFRIEPDPADPGHFVVHGEKPLRWIRQTDFTNDEAVGFLADRLAKLGVERELADLGAEPGAEVTIGDVTFDWAPAGADMPDEFVSGVRGTDARLERNTRVTAAERLAARKARRVRPDDDESLGPGTPADADSGDAPQSSPGDPGMAPSGGAPSGSWAARRGPGDGAPADRSDQNGTANGGGGR